MKKGWTTTKLIAVGSISILRFITRLLLYTSLLLVTGNILSSFIYILIGPFFGILTSLIVSQFGAVTLFYLISFVFELPTPSIWPKAFVLVMNLIRGLIIDTLSKFIKEKKRFALVGGFTSMFIDILGALFSLFIIGLPGAETLPEFILRPPGVIIIGLGIVCLGSGVGYLAFIFYQKIENTSVIKRIQG